MGADVRQHPEQDRQSAPDRTSRFDTRHLLRQGADAACPVLGFLVGYGVGGAGLAIALALVAAGVISAIRLIRGESLKAIGISIAVVVVHSLVVLLTGEGRGFFLPELVFNAVLAVVFGASLLLRRPISGVLLAAFGLESKAWHRDVARRRTHVKVTAMWLGVWCLHLVVWAPLYIADMVVVLGIASIMLGKPAFVPFAWLSWRMLREKGSEAS